MSDVPLHEQIAAMALAHVSNPPQDDDPVVQLASPDELVDAFSRGVGLSLGDGQAWDDDALIQAVEQVVRYSVHTNHPRFMNQNFAGADPLAVAGDWLGAALNTTAATYEAAPVFTLMEHAVLARLGELVGYPEPSEGTAAGLFCAGGSLATLMALQLARHRFDPDIVRRGTGSEPMALFVSAAGHYSALKNAAILGLGTESVVEVETDPTGAMIPSALSLAIDNAQASGRTPFAVIATTGTTVTAAFDPIQPIADICEEGDLWLHVDGCYGGSALFSPEQRHRLDGAERSDSMVWNLHKMMGMTQQCTALLVRDPTQLDPCFATGADYLFQSDKPHGELDAGDRTIMCARRVDVLKLWLSWKSQGDAGFAAKVDHAVALADHARRRVASGDGSLATIVEGDFTNMCFVWVPPELRPLNLESLGDPDRARLNALPPAVKRRMQAEGTAMLGYQPVNGITCFRIIVMNPTVSVADVDAVLELVAAYSAAEW